MKRWQKALIGAALSLAVVLLAIDWLTGLLTVASPVNMASLADIHPAVQIQVNTAPVEDEIVNHIRSSGRMMVPEALLHWVLPHGFTMWMAPDYARGMIDIRMLVQEKRGGPLIARMANRQGFHADVEALAFDVKGIQVPRRGAMTLNGWFPIETIAAGQAAKKSKTKPDTAALDGNHLFELHADNRDGAAYLVFTSLLHTLGINLDEQQEKISLTSFRFVDEVAITGDLVMGDSIGIVCEMQIQQGQKDKLAIVNLKAGLDELFTRLGQELQANHGLLLTGESSWHGNTLTFTYRLDDLPALLEMFDSKQSSGS